jgi:hypothetical protein
LSLDERASLSGIQTDDRLDEIAVFDAVGEHDFRPVASSGEDAGDEEVVPGSILTHHRKPEKYSLSIACRCSHFA